jgi:nucleotide-binding universal stress UspA family protein
MKFLVGFDGSNSAKAALALARTYAKTFNAGIVVVASVEGDIINRDSQFEKANANLTYAAQFLAEESIPTEIEILARGFKPGEDIVKFADKNEFDAVFIGLRRRSRVDKLFFGSNAQYIILHAPCPVISVK